MQSLNNSLMSTGGILLGIDNKLWVKKVKVKNLYKPMETLTWWLWNSKKHPMTGL